MGDEKDNRGLMLEALVLIGFGLFCLLIWKSASDKLILWWHLHQTQVLGVGAVAMTAYVPFLGTRLWNRYVERDYEKSLIAEDSSSAFIGLNEKGRRVNLSQSTRANHIHLLGTTGAGKTESIILPLAISDVERGTGLIIIDGKGDRSFLEKLYAYTVRCGRASEFRLFSLTHVERSSTFNPLIGGTPKQIAERVFSALTFESLYYRDIQLEIFQALISMVIEQKAVPTFILLHQLITDMNLLGIWMGSCQDVLVKKVLTQFSAQPEEKRVEKTSGLVAQLNHFISDDTARLFNVVESGIVLEEAVRQGQILYFQLPTMHYPFLAQVTGKLVLQSLQTLISQRHCGRMDKTQFFACILDDFQDYIYPEFAAHLNKSRSANVGVILSHQALGDLDRVGIGFRDIVGTSANTKIVMRVNEPESADYLAKYFGTQTTEKTTERRTTGVLGEHNTGEGSVRKVEEYIFHPNDIKQLHTGQGVVGIPHFKGSKMMKINFVRREDIPSVTIPESEKPELDIPTLLKCPRVPRKKEMKVKLPS